MTFLQRLRFMAATPFVIASVITVLMRLVLTGSLEWGWSVWVASIPCAILFTSASQVAGSVVYRRYRPPMLDTIFTRGWFAAVIAPTFLVPLVAANPPLGLGVVVLVLLVIAAFPTRRLDSEESEIRSS